MKKINDNREDGVKTEDGEIKISVHHRYIDDNYKNLINNIFTRGLKDGDLHLRSFNSQIGLNNIVSKYLKEKDIDVFENNFSFNEPIKIWQILMIR